VRPTLPLLVLLLAGCGKPAETPAVVGCKKFTESVILGEMAAGLLRDADIPARRDDLGATPVCWTALVNGDCDVYPEYTGTITREILKGDPPDLAAALAGHGVKVSRPLGFRNNYALAMRKDVAAKLGIATIGDLARHPGLRCGFTPEFLDRADGWPGLKLHYKLPQATPRGITHALAYPALVDGSLDVIEVYTTEGQIAQFDLAVLTDDRDFFPSYEAVWLYRADLDTRHPGAVAALKRLEGAIPEDAMRRMNGRVLAGESDATVAAEFLRDALSIDATREEPSLAARVARTTREHLMLVVPSLLAAVLVGVPLGVFAARRPRWGRAVLVSAGVVQTIPSLALLLFMIPVMRFLLDRGTGAPPAVAALFLYSLLPVVRNTVTGLQGVPEALRESALGLGLPRWAVLTKVELPLAMPTIVAGIKTAAVINVGTATLGGFIGAGGYGRPILRGLDKLDVPLMLEGAIPAAVMALAVEAFFELVERLAAARRG
jgi:osmoprotectant transport system permease protein